MWLTILLYVVIAIVSIIVLVYGVLITNGIIYKLTVKKCKSGVKLDGKTVLVTGGTAGIGLATAEELARRSARVIIACPFQEEGTNARSHIIKSTGNQNVTFKLLNLSSLSSVRVFAEDIFKTESRLDILINNAGVMQPDKMTADGLNFIMQVNYFGLFLLTVLLLPLLKKSGTISEPSRIVNLSSMMYVKGIVDFKNMNTSGFYRIPGKVYFNSKLCVVYFTKELAKRLSKSSVVVNAADPRMVVTNIASGHSKIMTIFRYPIVVFYPNTKDGAQSSLYAALDEQTGRVSGEYYYNCQRKEIAQVACDDKLSCLLWDETLKLLKLNREEVDKIFE